MDNLKRILHISRNSQRVSDEMREFLVKVGKTKDVKINYAQRMVTVGNEQHSWKTVGYVEQTGLCGCEFHDIVGFYPAHWTRWLRTRIRRYSA